MKIPDEVREWWTKALLGEQASAHPIFGTKLKVDVDGNVIHLSGTAESEQQAQEIEREARQLPNIDAVVNHITVSGSDTDYHLQTIIAVLPDRQAAELASQAVTAAKLHENDPPDILDNRQRARKYLRTRVEAAEVPAKTLDDYLDKMKGGKVLVADRVPEDDALRIISALEGSGATSIRTLPPEPATTSKA